MAITSTDRRTLYLTTPGTFVGVDHDAFQVRRPDEQFVRTPVRSVDALICYGAVQVSTEAIHRCAAEQIDVVWLSRAGRFRARSQGPTSGNVLLRIEQFAVAASHERSKEVATAFVVAKILNSRTLLLDAAKDQTRKAVPLRDTGATLEGLAASAQEVTSLDELRGVEGAAARSYFAGFASLIQQEGFRFVSRERRPPRDAVNALLSFVYGLMRVRCSGAIEVVGLDPQVGFLHAPRPGRPSLALDLLEEFRAPVVDRFVLTMINRRQVNEDSFELHPGGAVSIHDDARKTVLTAWDAHMRGSVVHRAFEQPVERGQLPHLQALLLARHLRGDLAHYLPYRTVGR